MADEEKTQVEVPDASADANEGRAWSSLERTGDETVAFAGALGAVGLIVLSFLLGGVPGVLLLFLILTLVIMGVLLVISMGN